MLCVVCVWCVNCVCGYVDVNCVCRHAWVWVVCIILGCVLGSVLVVWCACVDLCECVNCMCMCV